MRSMKGRRNGGSRRHGCRRMGNGGFVKGRSGKKSSKNQPVVGGEFNRLIFVGSKISGYGPSYSFVGRLALCWYGHLASFASL